MLTIAPAFRVGAHDWCMSANFRCVDREQLLLMPPSLAEWLPEGHLAWFVLDVVDEFDLSGFEAGYRQDGRGGAAYPPSMMLAVLVYAYAIGERSSRRIERRCVEDVAFRVLAANQAPDHATIARFRASHGDALAGLFGQVLVLCDRAGLIKAGLLAVDGTKIGANAARTANRTAEQLAAEILAEAAEVDAAEDARFGEASGNEVPEGMRGPDRKAKLRRLKAELDAEAERGSFEHHANERTQTEQAAGRMLRGRPPSAESWERRHHGRRHVNVTDPESRLQKVPGGFIQGYNAQAVATADQFIVAAEVTNEVNDHPQFQPMLAQAKTNLRRLRGRRHRVRVIVADAGYFSDNNANTPGVEALIAPGSQHRLKRIAEQQTERAAVLERVEHGELSITDAAAELNIGAGQINKLLTRRRAGQPTTPTAAMIAKLDSPRGKRLYKKRSATIEPVFAQIKHNRGIRTFMCRGLGAANTEWKLIATTHNLLKLWRLAPAS
jgi:transposase